MEFIRDTALLNYRLAFDIEAMVASDLQDESKFYPPAGRFYVARHHSRYVGVGCLKRLAPAVAELQRMYVQTSSRGIGVGRLLLERLLADAGAMKFASVRLESLKVLKAAHELYRSVGFRDIDPYAENSMSEYQAPESLDTYRANAVFMELKL